MKNTYTTNDLTRMSLVAACYVVITLAIPALSFGLGIRISEGLNFLALYHKRYVTAVTLGVFVVNYFAYGVWDMVIGSLTTFVFLHLSRYIGDKVLKALPPSVLEKLQPWLIKYLILALLMTFSMVMIALIVVFSGGLWESFVVILLGMMASEALSLLVGGWIIYLISQQIDLTR